MAHKTIALTSELREPEKDMGFKGYLEEYVKNDKCNKCWRPVLLELTAMTGTLRYCLNVSEFSEMRRRL